MDSPQVPSPVLKSFLADPRLQRASPAAIRRFGLSTESPVLDIFPEALQELALQIPPELLELTEDQLEGKAEVLRLDRRVKAAFWEEYELAAKELRQVSLERVVGGTGASTWGQYERRLTASPALMSWFLTPPVEYRVALKEAMSLSMRRLMDVLELPLVNAKGNPNVGVGLLILQAAKFLDARLHGAIAQRSINVNLNQDAPNAAQQVRPDMAAIDRRIAELEQALKERAVMTNQDNVPVDDHVGVGGEREAAKVLVAEVMDGPY